jgi:hypothetical protein
MKWILFILPILNSSFSFAQYPDLTGTYTCWETSVRNTYAVSTLEFSQHQEEDSVRVQIHLKDLQEPAQSYSQEFWVNRPGLKSHPILVDLTEAGFKVKYFPNPDGVKGFIEFGSIDDCSGIYKYEHAFFEKGVEMKSLSSSKICAREAGEGDFLELFSNSNLCEHENQSAEALDLKVPDSTRLEFEDLFSKVQWN